MHTSAQPVEADFRPETTFVIAPGESNDQPDRSEGSFIPIRFVLPPPHEFTRRGIPESALHD